MRIFFNLIILSGLILLTNVACRHQRPNSFNPTNFEEQWRAIYLQDKRVGYYYMKIIPNKAGYQISERVRMTLVTMGKPQTILSDFTGQTDSSYALKKFNYSFKSQDQNFVLTGRITNGKVILKTQDSKNPPKEIPIAHDEIYCNTLLGRLIAKKKFSLPPNFTVKIFEPLMATVVNVELNVLGNETVIIKDQPEELIKVSAKMLGLISYLWLDSLGRIKKEWSAPEMISIETIPDEILTQISAAELLDILDVYAVSSDTIINNPREVKWVKITFSDLDTSDLNLKDDFQKIISYNPLTLEIVSKVKMKDVLFPITNYSEYLAASFYVQSEHPEIIERARKIIGPEKSATTAAKKLLTWVYNNIKKEPSATIPQALEVLNSLRGDCNEHAVLYCALARAVGIPAEICVGLVYLDGKFYYHAWNKIYLGEWIAVDPTFGQFPADALHIKLSEGDFSEQSKVLKVIGKVKLKISEYR
ncbi:MAG: transglutaminase domain-containing protein [candidate division WOR-3 bacterium]